MADPGTDPLAGAFAEFSDEVAPIVRVAGVQRTREIVRARRRNQAIGLAALAAVVIAIPAAAFATLRGDSPGPRPAPGDTSGVSPAPSIPPSTAASTAPSSTPPSSAPPSTTAPNGVISLSALKKATLNLPGWAPDWKRCVSGPVKFTEGAHFIEDSFHVWIEKAVYADVDHDGADETVVRFTCGDQVSTYQVVAFDRDANGKIHTLGQVTRPAGDVTDICDIRVGADESIEVQVLDYKQYLRCLPPEPRNSRFLNQQWRSYGWDGSAFVQNGGPRTFPANPYRTDLAVSSSDLAMIRGTDGRYRGTMTITIRNRGAATVPYKFTVQAATEGMTPATTTGCAQEIDAPGNTICPGPKVAPGSTARLTLTYSSAAKVKVDILPRVILEVDDRFGDTVLDNNQADFQITF